MKGNAVIVEDTEEKAEALNMLMDKYQTEGEYESLDSHMSSVHEVTVVKVVPKEMRGKYKIGQHWAPAYRLKNGQEDTWKGKKRTSKSNS